MLVQRINTGLDETPHGDRKKWKSRPTCSRGVSLVFLGPESLAALSRGTMKDMIENWITTEYSKTDVNSRWVCR